MTVGYPKKMTVLGLHRILVCKPNPMWPDQMLTIKLEMGSCRIPLGSVSVGKLKAGLELW